MKSGGLSAQSIHSVLSPYVSAGLVSQATSNLLRIYGSPLERRDYLFDIKKDILVAQQLNLAQKDGLYVCCFSEKDDDPWMWEHYAQGGSGYCISYSFTGNCPRSLLLGLTPMIYQKKGKSKIIELLTNPLANGVEEFLYSSTALQTKMTAFAKDPSYEKEQEWRLGYYRPGSGSGFPFCLPFETEIILGPRFQKDSANGRRLLTLLQLSKIPFSQSSRSQGY